jgi:hypothetical protein
VLFLNILDFTLTLVRRFENVAAFPQMFGYHTVLVSHIIKFSIQFQQLFNLASSPTLLSTWKNMKFTLVFVRLSASISLLL